MKINMNVLFLFSIAIAFHLCRAKVNRSLVEQGEALGICFQEGVCGRGFQCIEGVCHRESRDSTDDESSSTMTADRRRSKRDTGLYCSGGRQAGSFCFPANSDPCRGAGYATDKACCGNPRYHCENRRTGNLCCQTQNNAVIVTMRPTPIVPVVPCIGPHCATMSPYNIVQPSQGVCPSTHIDQGPCSSTDYARCSMNGLGECINGRCCQKLNGNNNLPFTQADNCLPHYVPQFDQTLLLCPEGKICQNNRCVAGTCQSTGTTVGCPADTREVGPCNFMANNQRCSSTGTCYNGKCCEPNYQPFGQRQIQPYGMQQQVMPQQNMCTPQMCINPYSYVRNNNCCRRRK